MTDDTADRSRSTTATKIYGASAALTTLGHHQVRRWRRLHHQRQDRDREGGHDPDRRQRSSPAAPASPVTSSPTAAATRPSTSNADDLRSTTSSRAFDFASGVESSRRYSGGTATVATGCRPDPLDDQRLRRDPAAEYDRARISRHRQGRRSRSARPDHTRRAAAMRPCRHSAPLVANSLSAR